MKNHFYMSYAGNKREEVKKIYEYIPTSSTTIVEPFAGSCAMSYYAWTQRPELKFILNDNNPYLKEMYEIIKDDVKRAEFENIINDKIDSFNGSKERYNIEVKQKNIYGWFICNKYFNIRPGLYPADKQIKKLNLSDYNICHFFKEADITFTDIDGMEIYNIYKDNEECCILLDPPYLMLCNDFYKSPVVNIYEHLAKNDIRNEKAKIILILEDNWIIRLLYDKDVYNIISYDKMYQTSKKKTTHLMILNFNLFNAYKII